MLKRNRKRKIKVGIIANEFMDPNFGRLGGFGWAAKRASEVLNKSPDQEYEAVFLTSRSSSDANKLTVQSNGTKLLLPSGRRYKASLRFLPEGTKTVLRSGRRYMDILRFMRERIHILLSVDYRTSYNEVFNCHPKKPIVTWVRDPRSPADIEKMFSLSIPGSPGTRVAGLHHNDTLGLSKYAESNRFFNRRVILANKMPHLSEKNTPTYGLPASDFVLPNPDVIDYKRFQHNPSTHPRVLFLGRLDPIKRPWLFVELARTFPEVEFIMLGKNHFKGEGSWQPENIPNNVKMPGHVSGKEKYELLSSAWVLVNTSIHEESPVSVFEALASETPVLSYEDWGGTVKSYGITIGQHLGTGLDGMPLLVNGLKKLLTDNALRQKLGKAGHLHVKEEHNDQRFLGCFEQICKAAGVSQ